MLSLLGFIWALPCSILAYLLIILLAVLGQKRKIYVFDGWFFVVELKESGWFFKTFFAKRGFAGFSFGNAIFVRRLRPDAYKRILLHEKRHCQQYMWFGALFPILWFLESVRIYLFKRDLHSYYDNWFELDARKYAGQKVYLTKDEWANGPNDRWSLW